MFTSILTFAVMLAAFLLAFVLHELAHGWVADKLGDPTAREQGRLTLNPFKHVGLVPSLVLPVLTYLLLGFVLAAGKAVPVNSLNFKSARWGMVLVAVAGPLMNVVLAFFFLVVLVCLHTPQEIWDLADSGLSSWSTLQLFLIASYLYNVLLALFNLLPIPPLDGSHILAAVLPGKLRRLMYTRGFQIGGFVLILVCLYLGWFQSLIGFILT